jgi:hypothetical protein
VSFAPIYWALPVAVVLIALGWRPWRGEDPPRSGVLAGALLIPLCFMAGWRGWNGAWPTLLPLAGGAAKVWLLPGICVAALGAVAPRKLWVQALLAWVAAEVIVGGGHLKVLERQFPEAALWVGLAMKVGLVTYGLSLAALARRPGFEVPLLALIGLVAAATIQRGGWASGALLLAAVGCGVGGLTVVGLWRRGWSPLGGAALGVGAATAGVLLLGQRMAGSPLSATLLAAGVPLVGWIPVRGRVGLALRLLLAVGLAAGAHWLSVPAVDPYAELYG